MTTRIHWEFIFFAVLCANFKLAIADDPILYNIAIPGAYDTPTFSALQSFQAGKVAESIDPYSGRLTRTYTDLVLPGNGPSIVVTRRYNNLQNSSTTEKYRNSMGGITLLGTGWDINFGRVIVNTISGTTSSGWTGQPINETLCSGATSFTPSRFIPVLELSDGSRHPLYRADTIDSSTSTLMGQERSDDDLVVQCLPDDDDYEDEPSEHDNGGVKVLLPDGTTLYFEKFGMLSKNPEPNPTEWGKWDYRFGYVLTEEDDSDGNAVIYQK